MSTISPARLVIPRYGEVPGLPAKAVVLTNSERMELGCDRRWFYRYAERLGPKEEPRALRYGTAWARVMEDLHRWWLIHDADYPFAKVYGMGPDDANPFGSCPWCCSVVGKMTGRRYLDGPKEECAECDGSGLSVLFLLRRQFDAAAMDEEEQDERGEDATTLFRAFRGYIETYGVSPSDTYRVVGVELMVAAPVVDPSTGRPYKARVPLVEEADGSWRLARPGDQHVYWRSWPTWQIGKLDIVLQHRVTGAIWIEDSKSSRDPAGYLRNVTVDPQTTGYTWMLRYAIQHDATDFGGEVVGVQWDVASSNVQHYPKRLQDKELAKKDEKREQGLTHHPPALSRATNITTPSWLYLEAIKQAYPTPDGQRINIEDYAEHLRWCREQVDPRLYVREPVVASDRDVEDYQWEILGIAKRLAAMIRASIRATSPSSLAVLFPKTPLCRRPGGSCPFVGLCAGGDQRDARADFTISEGPRWERANASKHAISSTDDPSTSTDLDF